MGKTYRVNKELSELAKKKMIEYITEEQEPITEAEIINAAIDKGIRELKNKEIRDYASKE